MEYYKQSLKSSCCSTLHIRYEIYTSLIIHLKEVTLSKNFMSAANLEILSGLTLTEFPEDNTLCHH